MSNKKLSNVRSVYLPEYAEVEKIAVEETRLRKKPVTTGAIIREIIVSFISKYWAKK